MNGYRHPSLRTRHRYRQNEDDQVLPLVNVVFLLLIFFMIAGQMQAADPFGVLPPGSASRGDADLRPIVLYVAVDGRIAVDGVELAEAELAPYLAQNTPEGGEAKIRVKADAAADARRVIRVLSILRDAGFEEARLLTLKDPG